MDSNGYTYFAELKNDPEKIIRQTPLGAFDFNHEDYLPSKTETSKTEEEITHERIAGVAKANELLGELRSRYAIKMPLIGFVVGKDQNGSPAVFTVAERIHGEVLPKKDFSPEEISAIAEKLESVYISLLKYFWDKYKTQEPYLSDVARNRQFMYGNTKHDPQNDIYMVDMDVLPEHNKYLLLGEIRALREEALKMAERLGIDFDEFDDESARFLSSLPSEDQKIVMEGLGKR